MWTHYTYVLVSNNSNNHLELRKNHCVKSNSNPLSPIRNSNSIQNNQLPYALIMDFCLFLKDLIYSSIYIKLN